MAGGRNTTRDGERMNIGKCGKREGENRRKGRRRRGSRKGRK